MGSHTRTLYLLKQTQGITGIPSIHLHLPFSTIGTAPEKSVPVPRRPPGPPGFVACCYFLGVSLSLWKERRFSPEQKNGWVGGRGRQKWFFFVILFLSLLHMAIPRKLKCS